MSEKLRLQKPHRQAGLKPAAVHTGKTMVFWKQVRWSDGTKFSLEESRRSDLRALKQLPSTVVAATCCGAVLLPVVLVTTSTLTLQLFGLFSVKPSKCTHLQHVLVNVHVYKNPVLRLLEPSGQRQRRTCRPSRSSPQSHVPRREPQTPEDRPYARVHFEGFQGECV